MKGCNLIFQLLLIIIYLSFVSLGLPDSLLGSAWPSIYPELNVPVSYAGFLSMIICACTIASVLMTDRLVRKLGTGKLTAFCVALSALSLLGFSMSHSYVSLCLWAVPYGLAAGSIDSALNNYVALHYESRHMSWLHCMWGVGATLGPYIMGAVLTTGRPWNTGYRSIFIIQLALAVLLFISLPLWKENKAGSSSDSAEQGKALTLRQVFAIPGAWAAILCFFSYCAIEQTAGLWAGSYLTLHKGVSPDAAAGFASMFFIGITIGRAVCGFVTMKLSDAKMTLLGSAIIAFGIVLMLIPGGAALSLISLVLIGLGCAPVYPCMIHATPEHFGAENSQAVIGAQIASAYVGILTMPPLFGLMANHISVGLLPVFLLAMLAIMVLSHNKISK